MPKVPNLLRPRFATPQSRTGTGDFVAFFWTISGPFLGHFRVISGPIPGHFWAIYENVYNYTRKWPGIGQEMSGNKRDYMQIHEWPGNGSEMVQKTATKPSSEGHSLFPIPKKSDTFVNCNIFLMGPVSHSPTCFGL